MIVDIGTGDGRFVYRSARANPDRFYIGIDVQRDALEKVSEKVHRNPARGGVANAMFVHAPVEQLPPELAGVADEIHIHLPWGGLLRHVAFGDQAVLSGLRRIAAPNGWLEVLIGVDDVRDSTEFARLRLPPLTEEYLSANADTAVRTSGIRHPRERRPPPRPVATPRHQLGEAAAFQQQAPYGVPRRRGHPDVADSRTRGSRRRLYGYS